MMTFRADVISFHSYDRITETIKLDATPSHNKQHYQSPLGLTGAFGTTVI